MRTTDFVALYRGATVAEARLVAVTAEPEVVGKVIRALVGDDEPTGCDDSVDETLHVVRAESKA